MKNDRLKEIDISIKAIRETLSEDLDIYIYYIQGSSKTLKEFDFLANQGQLHYFADLIDNLNDLIEEKYELLGGEIK